MHAQVRIANGGSLATCSIGSSGTGRAALAEADVAEAAAVSEEDKQAVQRNRQTIVQQVRRVKETRGNFNWSDAEDKQLQAAVDSTPPGYGRWVAIAQQVGRTNKQCQQRWNEVLDPTIDHSELSEEEVVRLLALVEQMGTKWGRIAAELSQGRPLRRAANHCKNKHTHIQRAAGTAAKRPAGVAAAAPGAKRRK